MRKYLIFIFLCIVAAAEAQQPSDLQIERNRVHLKCRHRAPHRGIRRCVEYHLTSSQIPKSFDGFRIAFITDTHYKSRFNEKTLAEGKAAVSAVYGYPCGLEVSGSTDGETVLLAMKIIVSGPEGQISVK